MWKAADCRLPKRNWYKVSRRKPAPRATCGRQPIDLTTFRSATSKSLSSPDFQNGVQTTRRSMLGGIELVGRHRIVCVVAPAVSCLLLVAGAWQNVRERSFNVWRRQQMTDFLISQLLVGVVFVISVVTFQFRRRKHVLLCCVAITFLMAKPLLAVGCPNRRVAGADRQCPVFHRHLLAVQ